jgi:hypothetical protein
VAKLSQAGDLRHPLLFAAVVLTVAVAWNAVARLAAERAVLPVLRPGTDAAGPLRVTNNDGSLSNGDRLHGWDNAAYFATHVGLWMAGCAAAAVALVRVWPAKSPPNQSPQQTAGACRLSATHSSPSPRGR